MPVVNLKSGFSSGNLIFSRKYSATAASVEFGTDASGIDVKMYGDTTGKYCMFDASADALLLNCSATFTGAITVGVDDSGHDVKMYGATSGNFWQWDESADKMIIVGTSDLGTSAEADAYTVAGSAGVDFSSGPITSLEIKKGIIVYAA